MKHFQTKLIPLIIIALLTSCVKEYAMEDVQEPKVGMEALNVPDGFDYSMYEQQNFNVNFNANNGRLSGSETLQYAVIGIDQDNNINGLKTGSVVLANGLDISINKPLHIQQLLLYTKFQGNAQFFELNGTQIQINADDLIIDDQYFDNSNTRSAGTPDCSSFLGNATKISCKKDEIIIKSSASFLYVDITFNDGVVSRFETKDVGKVNKDENQWTFSESINNYSLDQVQSFTVYANCKTSPKSVGTELVTFTNPCYEVSADRDQDGIADEYDIYPEDPNISSAWYIPAKDKFSTFAFEDLWPYKGDYDFNDLVVSHHATVFANSDDFVTKVEYDLVIRAIGAKFNNDLCISFTDPEHVLKLDQIKPVDIKHKVLAVDDLAEIRLISFRDLFSTNGFVNTDTTSTFFDPVPVSLVLTFDGSVKVNDFKVDEYLRINEDEGRELHKPGVPFTSLIDKNFLGYGYDDTDPARQKYYKTKDNLPWVLEIPIEWDYPKENKTIDEGYPNFKDFAQGKSNSPWYTDNEGNKVNKHLYTKKSK